MTWLAELTADELRDMIADQQRDIERLQGRLAAYQDALSKVHQQREELLEVFGLVIDELDKRHCSAGNAPGHAHEIPGIWDSDNGKLAGKPCAWCAVWSKAKQLRAAIANSTGGQS